MSISNPIMYPTIDITALDRVNAFLAIYQALGSENCSTNQVCKTGGHRSIIARKPATNLSNCLLSFFLPFAKNQYA